MTKKDFVAKVAKKAQVTQSTAVEVIDAAVEVLKESLVEGEKIQFVGFGSFEAQERAARTGRNPQTGEAITIPAHRVPIFKASSTLKEAVK